MNCQEAYDKLQDDKVNKSGDTMTGDLIMNADISLGADKNINLANGDKIIFGGTESTGSTFEIKTVHQPTGSEHIISMAKVGGLTGSCIKFIEKTNMPEMCSTGYHQLPVNDGSSASNYYTLATVEKSVQKSGDTMTGNLSLSTNFQGGTTQSPSLILQGNLGTTLTLYEYGSNGASIERVGPGSLNIKGYYDVIINSSVNNLPDSESHTIIDGTTIPKNALLVTYEEI